MRTRHPIIISFSGIDGAGKSTQIEALEEWLCELGLQVATFSMWDDVVVGARWRECASRRAFGGDQGVGSPERPVERRDKNVSSLPLEYIRLLLYSADALSLWVRVRELQQTNKYDVIIFDRYIYDELANLPLTRGLLRAAKRLILNLVPAPDLACIMDAHPEAARQRKPEYPLEFLHRNREAYLALKQTAKNLVVLENSSVEETATKLRLLLRPMLSRSAGVAPGTSMAMLQ